MKRAAIPLMSAGMKREMQPVLSTFAFVILTLAQLPLIRQSVLAQTAARDEAAGMQATGVECGDWRRHEVVRFYRDQNGCRLYTITYHRPDGDVDFQAHRDCINK
ncbi:hypothetical protein M2322_004565 [Rhodoblastus acidophilus]|uniref:hypothetical protein n=1 Tax=Rhodoblastus acidophilus TaxID=1074 RepID=UPI002223FBDB|nr:hypothetical protein [Rhodoblastus acidophilus]MCW2318996.1 hypothetical protein [Rhodoblastus acidophilus]